MKPETNFKVTHQCHENSRVIDTRKKWCDELKAVSQWRLRVCSYPECGHVWETWEIDKKHLEKLIPTK